MTYETRLDSARDADPTREAWLVRLAHRPPAEIVKKLTAGDPLQLRELAARRLRERALFVDTDRLFAGTAVEIAHAVAARGPSRDRTSAPRDAVDWLLARVDAAIDGALCEDREEDRLGIAPRGEAIHPVPFLPAVEPGRARRAALEFNALPDAARKAFFALLIEGQSIEACLARGLGPSDVLRERVRWGLRALQSPSAREDECAA